jgi:hypothetical protein
MEVPGRFFSWIDRVMEPLPPAGRIVLWAAVAALASMELYRVLSPQARIRAVETDLRLTKQRLDAHDGDFADGWSLVRGMLGLSARRIVLVGPAAVFASLPILLLIVWMASAYQGARVLGVGPGWIGGWEATFFVALSAFALAVKVVRRIA